MANSKFKFEVNPEAASSNFKQLAENDFNLEELLNPEGEVRQVMGPSSKK